MTARSRKLNVRGNIALAAAIALAAYLGLNWLGAGGWTPLHTWMAVAMATAANTSATCYLLAGRRSPRGESPQVSHPTPNASVTPVEVQK